MYSGGDEKGERRRGGGWELSSGVGEVSGTSRGSRSEVGQLLRVVMSVCERCHGGGHSVFLTVLLALRMESVAARAAHPPAGPIGHVSHHKYLL